MSRLTYPAAALALAATLVISGQVLAQKSASQKSETRTDVKPNRQAERLARNFDINDDGKVTLKEITAYQRRLMVAVDVNGDGILSDKEFRRGGRVFRLFSTTSFFDLLDANGDQKLSADEITGPSARWFSRYDVNKNGVMEASELPQRHRGRGRRGRGGHRR